MQESTRTRFIERLSRVASQLSRESMNWETPAQSTGNLRGSRRRVSSDRTGGGEVERWSEEVALARVQLRSCSGGGFPESTERLDRRHDWRLTLLERRVTVRGP